MAPILPVPLVHQRRVRQVYCFFFQAEDGIRDYKVTGVQTCALPISWSRIAEAWAPGKTRPTTAAVQARSGTAERGRTGRALRRARDSVCRTPDAGAIGDRKSVV